MTTKKKKRLKEASRPYPRENQDDYPGRQTLQYNRSNGTQRKLRNPSRAGLDMDALGKDSDDMNGLPVWNNEGEELLYITNLDSGLSQEQFTRILRKFLTPEEFDILSGCPFEMQIADEEEAWDADVAINHLSLKEYISELKQWARQALS